MSEYYAQVVWTRGNDEKYIDNEYNRGREWNFDGGVTVPASSSPHVVPLPYSVETNVDPEAAFVASLSISPAVFYRKLSEDRSFNRNN